jgi:hyperosmotically inducible protein
MNAQCGGVPRILAAALLSVSLAAAAVVAPKRDALAKKVRHELVMLPFYGVFDNLSFVVKGNTVTLLGQVSRPSLRADAERAVRRIAGVRAVHNRIEVLPLSPHDDRIRLAVLRAVYGHSVLNRYALGAQPPIRILVKHGQVTLEGVVASRMDRNVAGIQANGVPGVFKVTNNLRVESKSA